MSSLRNSIKSKITQSSEWLETLDRTEFLKLFVKLKPRSRHGNFKSRVWYFFGSLCKRNSTENEADAEFIVIDDNFNYCRLCLVKQQQVLRFEEHEWKSNANLIQSLANNIKCYRTNTATGALMEHLLHDHGLENSRKTSVEESTSVWEENGHKNGSFGSVSMAQDVLLLQEVLAHNPFAYSAGEVAKIWANVARTARSADEEFVLDGSECHRRTNALIDSFKQEDFTNLRSTSGTEKQYKEREQLLQRLVEIEMEVVPQSVPKRLKTGTPEVLDCWDMSLETSLNTSLDDINGESAESSEDTVVVPQVKSKKRKRAHLQKKRSIVSLSLAKKELEIREKELAFKREQLELQKQQLQFERERFAAEQRERMSRYETEKEEREARLQLESEERRTLMEILKSALIKQQ